MAFIAKNPIVSPQTNSPPVPPPNTRGIFPKDDGWYEIDDNGNVRKLLNRSSKSVPNDISAVTEIIRCATSYLNHKTDFTFTDTGKGTLFDDDFSADSPKIDCSSAMMAWVMGIPYEYSKYAGKNNSKHYEYGIKLPTNPYATDRPNRYYTHELAHYFDDQGWCFVPDKNYSDIAPGDIIFVSFKSRDGNSDFHDNAYMKIDHCLLVIGYKDPTHLICLHTSDTYTLNYYDVCVLPSDYDSTSTNSYNNGIKLVARLPFKAANNISKEPIFIDSKSFTTTNTTDGFLRTITLDEPLKINTAYTLAASVENAFTQTKPSTNNYFGVRVSYADGTADETILSWAKNAYPEDNLYRCHFVTGNKVVTKIKLYILACTVAGHKYNYSVLYEGLVATTPTDEDITNGISAPERVSNKVTTLNTDSTDTQYPSAKAVYDELVKKLNADEAVGKKTEQGGEVFNNHDTNVALGIHSHAEGDKTSTGLVGLPATVSANGPFYFVSVPLDVINKIESYDVVDFYQDVSTDNNNVKYEFVKSVQVGTIRDKSFGINSAVPVGQYLIRVRGKDIGTDLIKQYSGDYAHAEGHETVADGKYSHVEGNRNIANGDGSHAEGGNTDAIGYCSHTEGIGTEAIGKASHAEGWSTQAIDEYSHAEGSYTVANGESQHVQGKWNKEDTENKYAHIVGNGTSSSKRSNAHTLDWDGNAWFSGDIKIHGNSYDDTAASTVATQNYVEAHIADKEDVSYRTTSINVESTDRQYPSAKAVYDELNKKADKTAISTSTETTASITLLDNTEARFGELTSLTVTLPETISDSFISSVVFKSGATATTVTVPSDVYCQGADCKNGAFLPKANKRYTMIFSYDGIMNCYIAAVPIQTAQTQSEDVTEDEVTVANDESVSDEPESVTEMSESAEEETEPNEVI